MTEKKTNKTGRKELCQEYGVSLKRYESLLKQINKELKRIINKEDEVSKDMILQFINKKAKTVPEAVLATSFMYFQYNKIERITENPLVALFMKPDKNCKCIKCTFLRRIQKEKEIKEFQKTAKEAIEEAIEKGMEEVHKEKYIDSIPFIR